jgi:hypothetical protein
MGQVIGRATANAGEPSTEPITRQHPVGTIMHTLFDVDEVHVTRDMPDGVARVLAEKNPIEAMF